MPLPTEGRPTDFGGAIGNYQMQVEASPMNLKVGDPLTVKVRIFGEGSLEAIQMPSIDHWTDFKTYPPNARTEASDPSGLKGSRFFEQVVILKIAKWMSCRRLFSLISTRWKGPITRSSILPWLSKCLPIPRRHLFPVLRSRGSLKPDFKSPGLRTLFPSSPFLARAWR